MYQHFIKVCSSLHIYYGTDEAQPKLFGARDNVASTYPLRCRGVMYAEVSLQPLRGGSRPNRIRDENRQALNMTVGIPPARRATCNMRHQ